MSNGRFLRMAKHRRQSRKPIKTSGSGPFKSEILKGIAAAIVSLSVGWLSALIVSPDQIYRKYLLKDANDFSGKWDGQIAGDKALLSLIAFEEDGEIQENKYHGTLSLRGRDISVVVSADSSVLISGPLENGDELVLSLKRITHDVRTVDENNVQLFSLTDGIAGHQCKKLGSGDSLTNFGDNCSEIKGLTHFFRLQ